jgi:hypothetical protein
MDPEPSNENNADKPPQATPRQAMPRPILHANDGTLPTAHPATIRKRSAIVVLSAMTLGVGATAYAAMSSGRNCQPDPKNPNQTICSSSTSSSRVNFFGPSSFDGSSSTSRSTGPSATNAPVRGGFGGTGAMHASTSS